MNLNSATIVDAGREIAGGRLSPVELVESTLRRIDRLNPTLKAFLTVSGDHAMERAKRGGIGDSGGSIPGASPRNSL